MASVTEFTEVDYPEEAYYPGVVSITEDIGIVEIAVRETGSGYFVSVDVPIEEYRRMIAESIDYLSDIRVKGE